MRTETAGLDPPEGPLGFNLLLLIFFAGNGGVALEAGFD
jgi:hypothetical protein